MGKHGNQLMLNLFLAFIWTFLHTRYTLNDFICGYVLGALLIWLVASRFGGQPFYLTQVWHALRLLVIFLRELIKSSANVAYHVFQPQLKIKPGIVRMDIYLRSPAAITLLSSMITLTPGTLTLEVAPDNTALYIHTLVIDDADQICRDIEESFEENILKAFRGTRKGKTV